MTLLRCVANSSHILRSFTVRCHYPRSSPSTYCFTHQGVRCSSTFRDRGAIKHDDRASVTPHDSALPRDKVFTEGKLGGTDDIKHTTRNSDDTQEAHNLRDSRLQYFRTPNNNGMNRLPSYSKTTTGRGSFSWINIFYCALLGTGAIAYTNYVLSPPDSLRQIDDDEMEDGIGKPNIGGPWSMVNCKTEKHITSEMLHGKFCLIYFGFTFCPDICPIELHKINEALEILEEKFRDRNRSRTHRFVSKFLGWVRLASIESDGDEKSISETNPAHDVIPIFVTVDPQRDTCERVAEYIDMFHPRTVGITGTPIMVKNMARKFRVYYNEATKNGDEDYLVDHSIIHYLMSKEGKFIEFYSRNMTSREIADKLFRVIESSEEKQKETDAKRKRKKALQVADA